MKPLEAFTVGLCGYLLSLAVNAPVADSRTVTPASTEPLVLSTTEASRSEQALNRFEQQLQNHLFPNPSPSPTPSPPTPHTPHPIPLYPPPIQPTTLPPQYIKPAQGILTSGYGWRWGRMHKGIDIAAANGTPIVASADGEVIFAGWNSGGYGFLVEVRHSDGSITRYAHNSKILVSVGQAVRQGEAIALMGSTGYSTGPHLHFEIILPGKGQVNPLAFLPSH